MAKRGHAPVGDSAILVLPENTLICGIPARIKSAASTLRFGKVVVLQRCRELTGPLISKVGYAVALKEAASIGDMMIMNP